MPLHSEHDAWSAGIGYDSYMGRWSRQIAAKFLTWFAPPQGADWLEIGCGTGALTETVLATSAPRSILATDRSEDFLAHARNAIVDPRARFKVADAQSIPLEDGSMDVAVSGLVLNFVPDAVAALTEMRRVLRRDGILAFYVWDYPGGGIGFIDTFWKAAAEIDSEVRNLDEGARFSFCTEAGLSTHCWEAGFDSVEIVPLEIATEFEDFEAFWHPFTLGAGPAPGYCMSLDDALRARLKARLAEKVGLQGPVRQVARAWAVRALVSA
ncbi:class I SAM-dependent methyltransferase [Nitratireductor sp. ZSWI3]|uniref:class I SAM-dependent methyltransferase n=1 Tax=Nitratireductor sp. ZSWI3 TaxID=2966359 RepID=UPI00214F7C27|nr:class I SAM-dependent methyltransferase [Nitratireductor sp. ZSWI3]MCR4267291.1 class I SAM-dependent methyltransferase [Nitratireductor sp. ZSWI3]